MTEPLGSLCLVLHAHLPHVLHHGVHPHGEAWLYEAAAEVYLPLLEIFDEVTSQGLRPNITVGLTPVLLEQLAHDRFRNGFVQYLRDRVGRAEHDEREFERGGDGHCAWLARWWAANFARRLEEFERRGRDIAGAFAAHARAGHLQLLSGPATHPYTPLLLNDQCVRAQLAAGRAASQKHLGMTLEGFWLPECAYRPAREHWLPAVLHADPRRRPGLEQLIRDAGYTHFVVDSHHVAHAEALGTYEGGGFHRVEPSQPLWDLHRGWRSPLELAGVASEPGPPACTVLARHPQLSEQVWSRDAGYPGAAEYLEFHVRRGGDGLRYHRVTEMKLDLARKLPYRPEEARVRAHGHARQFCQTVRDALREHKQRTNGREGVCVAPFDAELFGHWWFEGPTFLRDVILAFARDPSVRLETARDAIERRPPDKVMRLPEGSWGERQNHSVWLNDRVRWMWEVEYRAENRFLRLLRDLPWRHNDRARAALETAGRQLLLLQASDWPFVIHSGGAVDYGHQRFAGHATRFDRLCQIAGHLAAGHELDHVRRAQVEEADVHDSVFPNIDLGWWA